MDEDNVKIPGMTVDPRALVPGLYRSHDERMENRKAYQSAGTIADNGIAGKSAGRAQQAMQELLAMIETLDKATQILSARLEPVMSASTPETGVVDRAARRGAPDVSGLTNFVMQATENIVNIRARIDFLLQRIEL